MANRFQPLLDAQREHFLSDATKSYAWRIDQLDRMERMLRERQEEFCVALQADFGKPPFEQLFEITTMAKPVSIHRRERIPRSIDATEASFARQLDLNEGPNELRSK